MNKAKAGVHESVMTFEELRNGIAGAVRAQNEKLPFGECISYDDLTVTMDNGHPVRGFELVKSLDGTRYRLRLLGGAKK